MALLVAISLAWTCLLARVFSLKGASPKELFNSPFAHLANHCATVSPIATSEFHQRQASLAKALQALNASAYITEPGPSAQFFGNISKSHWKLSERPLLLIITPVTVGVDVRARISILTPKVSYFPDQPLMQ